MDALYSKSCPLPLTEAFLILILIHYWLEIKIIYIPVVVCLAHSLLMIELNKINIYHSDNEQVLPATWLT